MFLSLVMFGFIGGISGVVLGTEQLNVLMHNTIYVPGHFHGTVVAGTTLAFMAMTYLVVPLIFQRDIVWPGLARWQPFVFGIGAGGISLFMMGAGPRLDVAGAKLRFPLHDRSRKAVSEYGSHGTLKLPGKIILIGIFFTCFVLYYFVNWKYLSELRHFY